MDRPTGVSKYDGVFMSQPVLSTISPSSSLGPELRVLQLLTDLERSPEVEHALAMTEAVTSAGGKVLVAAGKGRMVRQFHVAGAEHIELDTGRSGAIATSSTLALLEEVHRASISVIHAHKVEDGLAAKALADAAGLGLVMTCHTPPDAGGFFARRSGRKHLTGNPTLTLSHYAADHLAQEFRKDPSSLQVVPAGIDTAAFDPDTVSSERAIALAERWGVVEDPRNIVLVPDASADSAWLSWMLGAIADPAMPDAVWVLMGQDAGDASDVPGLLIRAGIADRVRWISDCADWPAAYKLASLVVSAPPLPPAVARGALEGQAMGRNVVLTDRGAAREALVPGETGWLIPADDVPALVGAVEAALARDAEAQIAGALAARRFIRNSQSKTALKRQVLAHYQIAMTAV